jgi:hypothetical protein
VTFRPAAEKRPLGRAPFALLLGPILLVALVAVLVPLSPWGDQAVIQLSTDRAASLHQLLGPYSRFKWDHPGPLYFYLLLIPYKVLGGAARDLAVGSVLIAGTAACSTVAAVGHLAGRPAARWAAALSLVQLAAIGPGVVAEVWNPIAIVVPAGTLVVCCAALAAGHWWGLPASVAVGSFLLQTDVGTGVLVLGSVAAALVVAVLRRRGVPGWLFAGTVGLGLLLWLAPLWQQLTGQVGNLTLLWHFFSSAPPHQTWRAALSAVAGALWPPLRGRLSAGPPGLGLSLFVLAAFVVVALVAVGRARRAGRPEAAWMAAAGLVGLLLAVVSAERVTGPLFSYLVDWASSLAVVVLLSLVLVRPAGLRARVVGGLAAIALVLTSLIDPPTNSAAGRQVDSLWAQIAPTVAGKGSVRLHLASADRWPWQAGLMVDLTHHGYQVSVDPAWTFLFGSQFAPGPGADTGPELTVWRPDRGPRPPGREVGSAPGVSVFLTGA